MHTTSPPSHILYLCTDPGIPLLGPSGASAHVRGVARALSRRGPVHLALCCRADGRGAVTDELDLPLTTSPTRRWGWLPRSWREQGEVWDGRRLLERALIELSEPPALLWERHSLFSDAGMRSGLPRIVELNAPLALERARYGRVLNPRRATELERRSLQAADRVVAVSAWLARWAVEEAGCEPERVVHVPNGVEPQEPGDREGTRATPGLEGLVLGFLGSLKPWHGLERLPALLDLLPEATALVVGDGPTPVPEHPRIRAVGRVEPARVPDLVAAMDVGLAPYRQDAPPWFCPLKILAYQAQGVPVVAAEVGDAAHLLAEGGGEVVGTDEPSAWAEAIERQAGAERLPRQRTWDAVVAEALAGL